MKDNCNIAVVEHRLKPGMRKQPNVSQAGNVIRGRTQKLQRNSFVLSLFVLLLNICVRTT